MKLLKSSYASFGKIALVIGASLLGTALLLSFLWVISKYLYGFGLTALILAFQGLVWAIIGIVSISS